MLIEKTCKGCGNTKPLSEFYKDSAMTDGYLNQCKVCKRERSTDYRNKNLDAVRQYDRDRSTTSQRREQIDIYQRSDKGKKTRRISTLNYRLKNNKKYLAHNAVNNAVRDGNLIKLPCEVCGDLDSHGHHDDYDYPLKVRWLCNNHHDEWHRINGPGKNGG